MNFFDFFTKQSWWGKTLGSFFGYLIAGPVGALLGLLIGNLFDKGMNAHFNAPYLSSFKSYRSQIQEIFFKSTFKLMGHIAKADGRVSANEIQMARQTMEEMRLNHSQQGLAKEYFNEGKASNFDVTQQVTELKQACSAYPDLLKLFMDIQYRCAQVDGLTPIKIRALDSIFRQLGFAPLHQQYRFYEDFNEQQYSSRSQSQGKTTNPSYTSLDQAYAILEIQANASQQEVKKAYRRLISRNHPDKLIAQGLPAEMIKLANDKTQKITKAYEIICANKGW